MNKLRFIQTILCLLLAGCAPEEWQSSRMVTSADQGAYISHSYDGEIPAALKNWTLVTDVSNHWFSCNHGFILMYTKMSIDEENRIWIYGPDKWNGPVGGIKDNPGCKEGSDGRIIVYDPQTQDSQELKLDIGDRMLDSIGGWSHLGNGRTLLSSVFIYASPWDTEGGKGNEFLDLAILRDGKIMTLLADSSSYWSVPDTSISDNVLYAIIDIVHYSEPVIHVYDLNTEALIDRFQIANCERPRKLAVNDGKVFLVCEREGFFVLRMYDIDFHFLHSWGLVARNAQELNLDTDASGNIWIGYSYILRSENEQWSLERIIPEKNLFYQRGNEYDHRVIFGMMPYRDSMLFSLDGGLYLANYNSREWRKILHSAAPLPIAVGTDGKIYAFTGKYIISSEP
jgi:hypothetical protein